MIQRQPNESTRRGGRTPTGGVRLRRGEVWEARFTANGHRYSETLGRVSDGMDRNGAEEALERIKAEALLGQWQPRRRPTIPEVDAPTFHEFSSQWYADGLPGWAPNTAAADEYELSLLNGYLARHLLPEITYDEIKTYVRAARGYRTRRGEPLKTETIRKTLTRLGTILREARRSKLIPEVPEIPRLTIPKAERPRRTYLDTAERITALLDAGRAMDAEAERYTHVNRHAMLATLVFAGLRISELLALQWRDVNLGTGWIEIPASKTEAGERRIKVRPVLRETLATIKPIDANPNALVFATETGGRHHASNVRQRVLTKARDRAAVELPPLTPHSLRRTFASVLLAIGVPVPAVQRELGHRDPKLTLAVYAQVMEYEPEQIDALKALVEGTELPAVEPSPVEERDLPGVVR